MTPPDTHNGRYWQEEQDRRLSALERGEAGPTPVIYERIEGLRREIRGIKWILGVFTVAFVGAAVTLIFGQIAGGG